MSPRTDTLFDPHQDADEPPAAEGKAAAGSTKARGAAQGEAAPREDTRPLAARMRPEHLSDFVGQTKLLHEGSALREAIERGNPTR